MLGLKLLTHVTRTDIGDVTHVLQGNWQGVNGLKAAALGNVPDNSVVVRIPLDILGDVKIKKGDFLILGDAHIYGKTERELFTEHAGHIIRVRSVRVCGGLSDRVNHLEVIGS